MLKKDDKDGIIEHLKTVLEKVHNELATYDRSKTLIALRDEVENALNDVTW